MLKTLQRILYKYYLTGLAWMVWMGISMIDVMDLFYDETWWGMFMIITGLTLVWSERSFIKKCNSITDHKKRNIEVGEGVKSSKKYLNNK